MRERREGGRWKELETGRGGERGGWDCSMKPPKSFNPLATYSVLHPPPNMYHYISYSTARQTSETPSYLRWGSIPPSLPATLVTSTEAAQLAELKPTYI